MNTSELLVRSQCFRADLMDVFVACFGTEAGREAVDCIQAAHEAMKHSGCPLFLKLWDCFSTRSVANHAHI